MPETGPHAGEPLGVITIPSFYNNLSMDVAKEIESLKAQNVKGVIVDLRGNGGGSLTEATLLTGLFIEKGLGGSIDMVKAKLALTVIQMAKWLAMAR